MGGEIKTIIFGIVVCVAISCLISELEAKEISRSTKSELEALSQVSTQAAACKCTNGYCEKDNNGKLVCKCRVEYGLDTSGDKCTKCNCGSNANCTFKKGFFGANQKDCLCPKGSYHRDNTCKSCNCGKEFDCSFSIWAGKSCKCGTGYFDRNGVCVDKCSTVKCQNGGQCYIKGGKVLCNCTERFTGDDCRTDKCSTVKCQNGGQCYIKGGNALCNCTERYIGDNCQIAYTTESEWNTTSNVTDELITLPNNGSRSTADEKDFNTTLSWNSTTESEDNSTLPLTTPFAELNTTQSENMTAMTTNVNPRASTPTAIGTSIIAYTTESEWNTTSSVTDELITLPNNGSQSTDGENDFNTTLSLNSTTVSEDSSTSPLTSPELNTTQSENTTEAMTTNVNPRTSTPTAIGTTVVEPTTCKGKNPCQNGGTCVRKNGVETCLCQYPYGGKTCTDSYWCSEGLGKELCGTTQCDFDYKTGVGRCRCSKGEFYDYDKRKCQIVDKCPLTPQKCKGANEMCKNNECLCIENFKRNDKKICVPNFCETSMNTCGENAKCEENEDDPENVKCVCKENEVLSGKSCVKVNRCDLPHILGCQQLCNASSEKCSCYEGYTLQKDGKSCNLTTKPKQCAKNCQPGVCYKSNGTEMCLCPTTHVYKDGSCKDLCAAKSLKSGLCPKDACESHSTLGFRCKCDGLFTHDASNVTCRRKMMCSEGNGREICANRSAVCIEDPDSNEGFKCACSDSEGMDTDGICKSFCDLKIHQDYCETKKAVCEIEGSKQTSPRAKIETVVNETNQIYQAKRTCKCPPLFTFGSNGICEELAKASFIGKMPFAKSKYDVKYLYAPSVKSPIPDYGKMREDLRNSMRLLFGTNYKFADVLDCDDTATSLSCSVEVQFQSDPRDQVKLVSEPDTCISTGDDTCMVPPELILKKKDVTPNILTRADPCMENIKLSNCGGRETMCSKPAGDKDVNFECTCSPGFQSFGVIYPAKDTKTIIHKCEDIDECKLPRACPNRTRCLNTYGSYECNCLKGYKTLKDSDDPKLTGCVGLCDSITCGQGVCEVHDYGYGCKCKEGFSGARCDQKVSLAGPEGGNGLKVALIVMSTIVIPLALFGAYMVFKYRVLSKKTSDSYFDDTASTLNLEPLR